MPPWMLDTDDEKVSQWIMKGLVYVRLEDEATANQIRNANRGRRKGR